MKKQSVIVVLVGLIVGCSSTAVSHVSHCQARRRHHNIGALQRPHAVRSPWQGSRHEVLLCSAAAVALPSKRPLVVFATVLALLGVYRLQTSEPMRRSLYFWRTAGPIVAHYKFTKRYLKYKKVDRARRDEIYESLHNRYAPAALNLVLHLKGLYIKMGQIMANRPDFMPPQYIQVFTQLQDSIPPWDSEVVHNIAINSLRRDCPAFAQYEDLILDQEALGSASIGQVHRGVLVRRDSAGKRVTKEVAVKVKHEGAKSMFQNDFQVFRWLCRVAIPSWKELLDALEQQVMTEFCYRNEADSLRQVRSNMRNSRYKNKVCVPEPMEELCCRDVLVMELLHGKKLVDSIRERFAVAIGGSEELASDFLSRRRREILTGQDCNSKKILHDNVGWIGAVRLFFLKYRCQRLINLLVECHGHQIFIDGVWNGDPHFGNCLQLDDGRIGLIDYGQTRRIDDSVRKGFANVVVAIEESRKIARKPHSVVGQSAFDERAVADAMRKAGFATKDNDDDDIMLQYGRLLFDSDEEGASQGFQIPQEYFSHLMGQNQLVSIPDSALFVCRTSLMFRGMGHAIGSGQIRTAKRWYRHAKTAQAT